VRSLDTVHIGPPGAAEQGRRDHQHGQVDQPRCAEPDHYVDADEPEQLAPLAVVPARYPGLGQRQQRPGQADQPVGVDGSR
jgi:hypothetical protein